MRKALVFLTAVALIAPFRTSALAAEWGFYGSARMLTEWMEVDAARTGTGSNDSDLTWDLQGNSRIGARVKAGDIDARFEFGAREEVNLRILYGQWDFGPGKLLVGQHYSPVNYFFSNQVGGGDINMLPTGGVYGGRNPMIRFRFGDFPNTLDVAFLQPSTRTRGLNAPFDFETDTTIPKIELSWGHVFGPVWVDIGGGYNTFDVADDRDDENSIDSYILTLGLMSILGPFYINGDVYVGQNIGNYGMFVEGDAFAHWNTIKNDVEDTDSFGFLIVAGWEYSDMVKFEAGYGYAVHEPDFPADAQEDDVAAYYLQAVITIAKGFSITPEIGKIDYKDTNTGADGGDEVYAAVQWRIDF